MSEEEKVSIGEEEDQHLYSDVLYCPISKNLMHDPVVLPDGESYERNAVVDILLSNNDDNKQDIPTIFLSSMLMRRLKNKLQPHAQEWKKQQQQQQEQKKKGRNNKENENENENEKLINKLCEPLLYTNRALRIIIEKEISTQQGYEKSSAVSDSIRKAESSLRHKLNYWLTDSLLPTASNNKRNTNIDGSEFLSDEYYCLITSELMAFPVIDIEGHTYEHIAIETWLEKNKTSPITRSKLSSIDELYKNNAIQKLLQEERNRPLKVRHPSIQRWIDDEKWKKEKQTIRHCTSTDAVPVPFPTTPIELEMSRLQRRIKDVLGYVLPAILFVLWLMICFFVHKIVAIIYSKIAKD